MNEEIIPQSPNWFLSTVLTCLDETTIAYGANSTIVIGKYVPTSTRRTPEINVISGAHKERVTVIASSNISSASSAYWHCMASAGDDSVVKVWNWDSLRPLFAHNSHKVKYLFFSYNERCAKYVKEKERNISNKKNRRQSKNTES